MIKKLSGFVVLAVIVIMAIFFRVHNIEGKMTFEWDQSRDFEAVHSMLTTGNPILLGPIVRGSTGGFYIGPLYYYLITPLYVLSAGNPLSLMVVSVGLDISVICLLFFFVKSRRSALSAIIVSALWAGSPLIIHNSFVPWNVSLIPLWTLLFIGIMYELNKTHRFRAKLAAIFVAALSTNIHLSLLPLSAVFILLNWKSFTRLPIKQYILLSVAAILPISTLIIHDLLFHFENTILLKRFLFGVTTKSATIGQIISLIVEKYGYTIGRLFTGEPYTLLGLIIVGILVGYGLLQKRKDPIIKYSLLSIAINIISLLIYRDSDFAEYYFMPTFIPVLLLLAYFSHDLTIKLPRIFRYFIPLSICLIYLYLGVVVRSGATSPYSLSAKKMIISKIRDLDYPVELRTSLPRERNTGFDYLSQQMGVVSDPTARRKAYIYEVNNLEVIAPPEARSIILDVPILAFKLIVFSN